MNGLEWKQVSLLALILSAAVAYLAISLISLASAAVKVGANTAPSNTFGQLELGEGPYDFDYVWNWDFNSDDAQADNVDWGFRFIFGNEATVDHVKNRLDGDDHDPPISPILNVSWNGIGDKYAYLDDGPEQGTASYWNRDNGFKNNPDCAWNDGHMRVYGRNDHSNYSLGLGNYVIATVHEDFEDFPFFDDCENEFRSFEEHEEWWLDRIRDNLAVGPYNWEITEDAINWNNAAGTASNPVEIGEGAHLYHSDGWGAFVSVSGD